MFLFNLWVVRFLTGYAAESQYTYVYESPGYETLRQFAEEQLGGNSAARTKEILEKVAKANLTPSLETQRRGASVSVYFDAAFSSFLLRTITDRLATIRAHRSRWWLASCTELC
jgi:hypothetical protein